MSVKRTKEETRAEIVKSFAVYFKDSNDKFHVTWLGSADEDDNKGKYEFSESIDVHNETVTGRNDASSSPEPAEKEQKLDCQLDIGIAVYTVEADQLNDTGISPTNKSETLPSYVEDEKVENLICDFVSLNNGPPQNASYDGSQNMCPVVTDANFNPTNQNDDSCAGFDEIEAASTISAELSRYITLYDKQGKKLSSDVDKELENLIGDPLAFSTTETMENDGQHMSTESVNNQCTYDRVFDVLPDAQDPLVFHVCPTIPGNGRSSDLRMIRGRHQSSIFYSGPELKRCSIPIRDFRVKLRKPNPLANIEFFAEKPAVVKKTRKVRRNCWRKPKRTSTVYKRVGKNLELINRLQAKDKVVVQHPSLWSAIQEAYPKPTEDIAAVPSAPVNPNGVPAVTIEEKNVSINEWLELSSQVQPDNNVEVNEFLQYASLPILSDIEDDAYQLSTFVDFPEQNVGIAKPANIVVDATNRFPQPLDLSSKQATPTSTDSGFCTGSFSFDVASPYHSNVNTTQASHSDVQNAQTANVCIDSNRFGETTVATTDSKPSTAVDGDLGMEVPLNTETSEKQLCVVQPIVDVTPVVSSTETQNSPESKASQRIIFPSDWNIDNYSTDLDYEPSDDEDDNNADDVADKLSTKSYRTESPAFPLDSGVNSEPLTVSCNEKIVKAASVSSKPADSTSVHVVQPLQVKNDGPAIELIEIPSVPPQRPLATSQSIRSKAVKLPSDHLMQPAANDQIDDGSAIESIEIPSVPPQRPLATSQSIRSKAVKLPSDHLMQPAANDKIDLLKQQVDYLLNRVCLNILSDETCSKITCRKNHNLPPADEVQYKLEKFPTDTILSIYTRFIVVNRMAFVHYFPAMCAIFSSRKLKSPLIAAVRYCDHHNKKSFYDDIYHACVRMGMFKLDALTEIARVSCKSTISCTFILNIIVKEDPELFKEMLKDFYLLANVSSHHMLLLLSHLAKNPEPTLLKLFVDIFNTYSRSDISDVGPYKMIFHEIRSLVSDQPKLLQRLNSIGTRDGRLK